MALQVNHTALVLPGAVAKGAYEAGVIEVLLQNGVRPDRLVATSSGSLNALALAVGLRSGAEKEMIQGLIEMWIKRGSWSETFRFAPLRWLKSNGLSSREGLVQLMRDLVKPCQGTIKREITLRIIVTPLRGVMGSTGKKPATTYEQMFEFRNEDFDTQESLEKIFNVVAAACAFPGLFQPVDIPNYGPCIDGGTVNNAPMKYALEECDLNQVYMAIPSPSLIPPPASVSGINLLNHLVDILINERLYRDLNSVRVANQQSLSLDVLANSESFSPQQVKKIHRLLHLRKVDLIEIRPDQPLSGSPFSGFFSEAARTALVEEGRRAAHRALQKDQTKTQVPT